MWPTVSCLVDEVIPSRVIRCYDLINLTWYSKPDQVTVIIMCICHASDYSQSCDLWTLCMLVIFHAFVVLCWLFFSKLTSSKNSFKNTISIKQNGSNVVMSVLICTQTVCKGYQQTTKVKLMVFVIIESICNIFCNIFYYFFATSLSNDTKTTLNASLKILPY